MGGMPLNDMPWWRWRSNVRSALHMLSDPQFQQNVWLAGVEGYGDVTDAVYRLVEDTWLDNWSAEKYVGTIFRDSQEAALVDTAVLRVLRIMHQVGPDAPVLRVHGEPGVAGRGAGGAGRARADGDGRRGGPGRAAAHAPGAADHDPVRVTDAMFAAPVDMRPCPA
ncbi:hypothetical protein QFZ22_005764 [Streptomyces canus]|uniref:Uncharacterized protein n=1 Tax=Streptomyces canus TaxID=58343 RepID=A0AAW8FJ96_9ACTN|nr:hypothetical protein [Streptomyces canus]